jgi:hypothetical protein
VEPLHNRIADDTAKEGENLVWFLFKYFISLMNIEISNLVSLEKFVQFIMYKYNIFKVVTSYFGIHTQVKKTAENVDDALRELPDANMVKIFPSICILRKVVEFSLLLNLFDYLQKPEDLWMNHSKVVLPKPHRRDDVAWKAIQKVLLLFYLKLGKIHSTHFHVKLPI